jgi:hypothetical protein
MGEVPRARAPPRQQALAQPPLPKAEARETRAAEAPHRGAHQALGVIPTIDLDNEPRLRREEVNDEAPNDDLAPKHDAKPLSAELCRKALF